MSGNKTASNMDPNGMPATLNDSVGEVTTCVGRHVSVLERTER